MKGVELYGKVRHAVLIEGLSRRAAARLFGLDPRMVAKMLVFSVPPGYRCSCPTAWPKLDRSWASSIGSWRMIRAVQRSSVILRSGSSSGYAPSTGIAVG
jgi:hypothetical protein